MLAEAFLREADGLELSPPLHNSRIFVQANGWNTDAYFHAFYEDRTPFPLLLLCGASEGIMYIPISKAKAVASEVFQKYWTKPSLLEEKEKQFHLFSEEMGKEYDTLTYAFVATRPFPEAYERACRAMDHTWKLNTLAFFSIYFDQEMAVSLLESVGSSLTESDVAILWNRATTPVADSFDKRREKTFIRLLRQGCTLDHFVEPCQYFEAAYHHIPSQEETRSLLQEKYGKWIADPAQAVEWLKQEEIDLTERVRSYKEWLATLPKDGQKLVRYLQFIMDWRDRRKDDIGKMLVVTYRVAERAFAEAGLDFKHILYSQFEEIGRGTEVLRSLVDVFERREKEGCAVFVHSDGRKEGEDGNFEGNKEWMESVFLLQQTKGEEEQTLRGQVGSPGRVQGRVRVVKNIDVEGRLFETGEVLVTGMTRPEFVPLMKKATAVVTDEGGITCHAAIISREMKIPCVIGTKVATRILKDGDLVEVDAEKGIVKILERFK